MIMNDEYAGIYKQAGVYECIILEFTWRNRNFIQDSNLTKIWMEYVQNMFSVTATPSCLVNIH
jgi:hypothetical protein